MSVVTGGTDTHLFVVDLKPKGIDGARAEFMLELCNITVNKNMVPGDKSALSPGGLRLGLPSLTTRNMDRNDMKQVADFIVRALEIAVESKKRCTERLKGWKEFVLRDEMKEFWVPLREEVRIFSIRYPMPGANEY